MTLQTELGELWEQYKKLVETGTTRTDPVREIEAKIHAVQKAKGYTLFDFDLKWARKEANATPSVEGGTTEQMNNIPPTKEDVPVPVANFTLEQARERVGDNNIRILEDIVMDTECEMLVIADLSMKINPENRNNLARRGSVINNTLEVYRDKKELKPSG